MTSAPNAVDQAITTRMSARAFTAQPVPREVLTHLLELSARAPSGTNTQPWKVYVLQGQSRDSLVQKVCAAHDEIRANPDKAADYREAYDYYPENGSAPSSTDAAKTAGACTACWALAKPTKTRCMPSTNATSSSLTPL